MGEALPVSARLAWWATAWLRGHVAPDDLLDGVIGDDVTHVVLATETTLLGALADLRARGAQGVGLALPTDGDPLGLGGPAAFNGAALEVGEAAVADGVEVGLVPSRVGPTVEWTPLPARRRQLPDVGEADRELRAALLDAAERLAALDVARWRPEVADRLMNLRRAVPLVAPPGTPARCVDLATRGVHVAAIAELALEDDGGAVSASEIALRRDALVPLERAGRRALVAACSPAGWPPPD